MLKNRNILLGVSGGIAVYKAAALTSKLVQAGANVKVIMTKSACEFVSPLTFQALSRNEVYTNTFEEPNPRVIAHIDAADWADLVIVAPATANVIGKLASGIADDMLTTTLLATTAPVWIAPAMNVHMYDHPAVQRNISVLYKDGYRFIEPSEGYLACGYIGKGRLEEPERIVQLAESYFSSEKSGLLEGKRVVITAGPTREQVDPVRFFSNRSTGKMGYAFAEEAARMGAHVTLIAGPTSLDDPAGVDVIHVQSAEDMYQAALSVFDESDIVIKTAAVADYRPKHVHDQKMKKKDGGLVIELERTKDILKALGERKTKQILVGFAAETQHVEDYAKQKLETKNLDMIVANNITAEGAGFGTETNIVTVFHRDGKKTAHPLMSKREVAAAVLKEAAELAGRSGTSS
ncbi:bifunctional phosphopantothenoylcysteine decarboxylase/phosphopantothenate--cysteine ligase CoaBC [Bacillus sp. GM2]|jgi:phosphopantothenoylcysteine decarboxylase/phosphopantothenate--cysteine ligase|uniref:Coenzyme A biosynthesis bifunctional protein CoaBC n=1 Tax=Bacillus licheniformis TaxID=1402 RepID=A0A415J1E0_BACLI|nr:MULTISPECIES: bifunctional phosphopantothenoylcysteine decarboxylase/phosphopantothenate--cysteine ligase CoaBC [Bacillus]MBJ7887320.1 bifunctional phosphopantothenoylcysteine decarboxylase/phosphopantothenate--cysteine ligase CoaBC [Bacillaceae bacterium HSR45]MBY8346442.1 bifunctional phosphopantothenoylcysteine decarboxylase/phosphopantothenate--cysteine ligase CoaBC [Bacillus sp. PCH94]MDP4135902.1 bifunctional phosphopantothenoylcysteine decarboxylase/phosphopantothenate--cysteine ligase